MTPPGCHQAPGGQVHDRARKPQAHGAEHGQILQRVVVTVALPSGAWDYERFGTPGFIVMARR